MPTAQRLFLLAAICLCVSPLAAQPTPAHRFETHASIGAGGTYDDEGSIGSGLSASFGAGYRLTPRFGVEGEYTYLRFRRDFGIIGEWKGGAHTVTGNALLHFRPKTRVQPFLLLGAGALSHTSGDGPGFAWTAGAGLKGYLSDHIFLRPEIRFTSGRYDRRPFQPEPPISNLRFQFGIGYRW